MGGLKWQKQKKITTSWNWLESDILLLEKLSTPAASPGTRKKFARLSKLKSLPADEIQTDVLAI